jgi:putative lipoprotein
MAGSATLFVRGAIVVPADAAAAHAADIVVEIEDVSRADAAAQVIGEQRQEGVAVTPGGTVPFEIEVPSGSVDERHIYSLRAHVDVTRSGTVEVGDLVSTQSYPVLTRGHGREATIAVRTV